MTGAETARTLVQFKAPEVYVYCDPVNDLAAHYDPALKVIGLGRLYYFGNDTDAAAAAAHEAAHAIQHAEKYWPFHIRKALWPYAHNLAKALPLILLPSLVSHSFGSRHSSFLIHVCLSAYLALFCFHLLTLPIEFNASRRALASLTIEPAADLAATKHFLRRAAMSYVFAFLTAPWQAVKRLKFR